jgi:hypothetical protein
MVAIVTVRGIFDDMYDWIFAAALWKTRIAPRRLTPTLPKNWFVGGFSHSKARGRGEKTPYVGDILKVIMIPVIVRVKAVGSVSKDLSNKIPMRSDAGISPGMI